LKKLLLVSLICLFIFGLAITVTAKVNLTFWAYPYFTVPDKELDWFESKIIQEFEELYPEVEVDLEMLPSSGGHEKIEIAVVTGTQPDILLHGGVKVLSYAAAGILSDFEDTMDAEEQADHYSDILETSKVDGKVYAYYLSADGSPGLEINRFIAQKAGAMGLLPLDRKDRTWSIEEFKKFALKIAEADIPETYAFALHFTDSNCQHNYIKFMHQAFGATPFVVEDGKYRCTMNSPEAVEGLEWYVDLYNTPGVGMPGPESIGIDYYTNYWYTGKLAFTLAGGSIGSLAGVRKDPVVMEKLDMITVAVPTKEGIKPPTGIGTRALGVFKSTPEKEKYAKLFCEFYATRPYLWEESGMACPPRKGCFDPNSPLYQTSPYPPNDPEVEYILRWPEYMTVASQFKTCPVYQQYRSTYASVMQGVFSGELTPKEGLNIFTNKINKLLDEYYEENPVE